MDRPSQGRRLLEALAKEKEKQQRQNQGSKQQESKKPESKKPESKKPDPKKPESEKPDPKKQEEPLYGHMVQAVSQNNTESDALSFTPSERDILNLDFIRELNGAQATREWLDSETSQTREHFSNNEQQDYNTSRCESLDRSSTSLLATTSAIYQAPPQRSHFPFLDNSTPEDESFGFTQPGFLRAKRQLFGNDSLQDHLTAVDALAEEGFAPLEPLTPVELQQLSPAEDSLAPPVYQTLDQAGPPILHEEVVVSTFQSVALVPDEISILDVTPENNSQTETHTEEAEVVINNKKRSKRPSVPSLHTPPRKRQRSRPMAAAAKLAYNSGLAHTSVRGKEIKARSMRKGCHDTCRRKCQERITVSARQKFFKVYYGSQSKNSQWHILTKYTYQVPVAHRKVVSSSPYRKFSYKYYLPDDEGRPVVVCQTMFLDTLDISVKVVQTAHKKNSPDKRGKHENRKTTSPILIGSVKDHIKSFPVIESHYCREGTRRRYLQANLSVARMYRLYIMQVGKGEHTASLRQYRDIFNCSFNLGFYKPKKDQCSLCFKWNSLSPEDRVANVELKREYDEHQEAKTLVRNIKKEVKDFSRSDENSNGRVKVICFDLQKVFFCPKSEVGEFFYKRKISAYNFTVFDCTKKCATCFVWDQTVGGRGAVEISSCVYEFIKCEVENGVRECRFMIRFG
ncbi:GATOR complex protein MIOS [Frankliniella fusca]|uniref:GATOR complex protein MIOS n=1 Tax=Frankliniella fusca TaxID=407009 RepID=A0AAE1GY41_9NEOP|nr:GATOR complex protein MIOS [Frankliniella fusca]